MESVNWICESYEDECYLLDSKHYETLEHSINLYFFDAYDEKGNKIECERIILKPKNNDNSR